ncbi:MAG: hypothetical protein NTZ80_03310 [Patescibacteria group bacterium]|nr:hypothetical protein [Patescibacteria group bacterium]
MPTYTYKCADCNKILEIELSLQEKESGADKNLACSKCKSKNLKRQFSISNFFKNTFEDKNSGKSCCNKNGKCCPGSE